MSPLSRRVLLGVAAAGAGIALGGFPLRAARASHAAPLEKPELVNRLILDFLAEHQTKKLMPLTP